jgi:hypothetical protein
MKSQVLDQFYKKLAGEDYIHVNDKNVISVAVTEVWKINVENNIYTAKFPEHTITDELGAEVTDPRIINAVEGAIEYYTDLHGTPFAD